MISRFTLYSLLMLAVVAANPVHAKGREPCSGNKGGISHCDGDRFVCNDGSYSASKRVCNGYYAQGSSEAAQAPQQDDSNLRDVCELYSNADKILMDGLSPFSSDNADSKTSLNSILQGTSSPTLIDVAGKKNTIPAVNKVKALIASYHVTDGDEKKVINIVTEQANTVEYMVTAFTSMASAKGDKQKLKVEWAVARPRFQSFADNQKLAASLCQANEH